MRLGLLANRRQFALLVLVNAFVGAMVGQERVLLPLIAEQDFGLASRSAVLSFIATFGFVKALVNLAAGALSDRLGRRRLLVAGWLVGLPVPLLLIWAPSWPWIVFANALLGVNQGLCWSTTVIMKIDLVGPQRRGLAMGLNEFAGYVAVSLAALTTGLLAASGTDLRHGPLYPGIAIAVLGTVISAGLVRDTRAHAALEGATRPRDSGRTFGRILLLASWRDRALFAASQAGMVNNLNDGVAWGLVPLLLARAGLPISRIALVAATYPAVWGIGQLATGALSDRWGRKWLIAGGMLVQAIGLATFAVPGGLTHWMAGAVLLGIGTAMVYPTLLAAVSDVAHPDWRATTVGVYRLWRDGGYVAGALGAGVLADLLGLEAAIAAVAVLTAVSGVHVAARMPETRRA